MAGKTRLINQIVTAVNPIPRVFIVNIPINCKLISPLSPTSINAIVGTIANTKNKTLTTLHTIANGKAISNSENNKKYCTTKTRYRKKERSKMCSRSCTLNVRKDSIR